MSPLRESPSRIEPCSFESDIPRVLADLATEIHGAATDLEKALHPGSARELAELVRAGFLKSDTPKSALRVAFPVDYRDRLFPNLFADGSVEAPDRPALSLRR